MHCVCLIVLVITAVHSLFTLAGRIEKWLFNWLSSVTHVLHANLIQTNMQLSQTSVHI